MTKDMARTRRHIDVPYVSSVAAADATGTWAHPSQSTFRRTMTVSAETRTCGYWPLGDCAVIGCGRRQTHDPPRKAQPEIEDRVNVERSRVRMLAGAVVVGLTLTTGIRSLAGSGSPPGMTVYKSPT